MEGIWIIFMGLILFVMGMLCWRALRRWAKGLISAFRRYHSLKYFINRHAQESPEKTKRATSINSTYIPIVEQHLKSRALCDRIALTGSAFEGLVIDESESIRFKALIIMPVSGSDIEVLKIRERLGYVWLKHLHGSESSPIFDGILNHSNWNFFGSLLGARYVDADKTLDLILKEIQRCISESNSLNGNVKLNRNGLVLQMDVYPDSWFLSWGSLLYSLIIIPAYEIYEELYVSRPVEDDEMPDTMTWHRSSALLERQILLCEGAKKILRVLKVLRKRDADFGNFTFYQLKTVVLYETVVNQDWSEFMLTRRLDDVLARLEKCLAAQYMYLPHYFSPEINLLSKIPPRTLAYMSHRIQHIRANDNEIVRLLQI